MLLTSSTQERMSFGNIILHFDHIVIRSEGVCVWRRRRRGDIHLDTILKSRVFRTEHILLNTLSSRNIIYDLDLQNPYKDLQKPGPFCFQIQEGCT